MIGHIPTMPLSESQATYPTFRSFFLIGGGRLLHRLTGPNEGQTPSLDFNIC